MFFDVAQAFDSVRHNGLVVKLSRIFPSNVCALLQDYFSHHTFFVISANHISSTRSISAGVPQGNVLSPPTYRRLLHLLLRLLMTPLSLLPLTSTVKPFPTCRSPLVFSSWVHRWKILLNSDKSVNITFAFHPHPHTPVTLNNTFIPYHHSAKYFGVHLDARLTYTQVKCGALRPPPPGGSLTYTSFIPPATPPACFAVFGISYSASMIVPKI